MKSHGEPLPDRYFLNMQKIFAAVNRCWNKKWAIFPIVKGDYYALVLRWSVLENFIELSLLNIIIFENPK